MALLKETGRNTIGASDLYTTRYLKARHDRAEICAIRMGRACETIELEPFLAAGLNSSQTTSCKHLDGGQL